MSEEQDNQPVQEAKAPGTRKAARLRARIFRRTWQVVLAIVFVSLVALAAITLLLFKDERFWRGVILPQALGPEYEKTLRIDGVSPSISPLGIELTGITVRDDTRVEGDFSDPVFTADRITAELSWSSRPGNVQLRNLEVIGTRLKGARNADGVQTIRQSFAAIGRGKPLSATTVDTRGDGLLPRIVLDRFYMDGLSFQWTDHQQSPPLTIAYDTAAPVYLTTDLEAGLTSMEPSSNPGDLHPLTRIISRGPLRITKGRTVMNLRAEGVFDLPTLANYPNSVLDGSVAVFRDERSLVRGRARVPLGRAPYSLVSVPFESFDFQMMHPNGDVVALVLAGVFDPIPGKAGATIRVDAEPEHFADAILEWFEPADRPALREEMLGTINSLGLVFPGTKLITDLRIDLEGVMDYARPESLARRPFRIETKGQAMLTNIPLSVLGGGGPTERSLPSRLRFTSTFSADESAEVGNLWFSVIAERMDRDTTNTIFRVDFGRENSLTEGVDLKPFRIAELDAVLKELRVPPPKRDRTRLVSNYDYLLGTSGRFLSAGRELLSILDVRGAQLRFRMDLTDQNLVHDLVTPVFGQPVKEGPTNLEMDVTYRGGDAVNQLRAGLTMESLQFEGVPTPLHIGARGVFMQEGDRIDAQELWAGIKLARGEQWLLREPGGFDLELTLARSGMRGELGPPLPTYLDLGTREGHFELRLESVSRELIEVFLQVQTFNLSETLARPMYQRLLDLLNLNPQNPSANARARMFIRGDLGEVFRIHSVMDFFQLSPRAFLRLPMDETVENNYVDVRWEQEFSLDRPKEIIAANAFLLEVIDQRGRTQLSLELGGDLPLEIKARSVMEDLGQQFAQLAETKGAGSPRQFVRTILQQIASFSSSTISRNAELKLRIPGFELAQWRAAFQDAGIPILGGVLHMELTGRVDARDGEARRVRFAGDFDATNLILSDKLSPIPSVSGTASIEQVGEVISIPALHTEIRLDPAFPPTSLDLRSSFDEATGRSETHVHLGDVNGAVFALLAEVEGAGIRDASALLSQVPITMLRDIADKDGRVSLEVLTTREGDAAPAVIRARETGENLRILSGFFSPLRFDLHQEVSVHPDGRFQVTGLSGEVTESGNPVPLLTVEHTTGTGVEDGTQQIRLRAMLDLARQQTFFSLRPLPIIQRTLDEGIGELEIDLQLPATLDAGSLADGHAVSNLRMELRDVRFSGSPDPLQVLLRGTLRKSPDQIALQEFHSSVVLGRDPVGSLTANAAYEIRNGGWAGSIGLVDWNTSLLRLLPDRTHRFLETQTAVGAAQFTVSGTTTPRRIQSRAVASLRQVTIPPLELPGRPKPWTHPPLRGDLALALDYDAVTSAVLLQELVADLETDSATPEPIAQVLLSAPLRVLRQADQLVAMDRDTTSTLLLSAGPLRLERFGPLFLSVAGVPLVKGDLSAKATITPARVGAERTDFSGSFSLAEGRWLFADQQAQELAASATFTGSLSARTVRLSHLTMELDFPEDPRDQRDDLTILGTYETSTEPARFDVTVTSTGIQFDRIAILLADLREPVLFDKPVMTTERTTAWRERAGQPFRVPVNLRGSLSVRAKDLAFRRIVFPEAVLFATYDQGRFALETFRAQAEQGSINLSALADFTDGPPKFRASGKIDRLEAEPFIRTLVPTVAARLRGQLEGTLEVAGEGATAEALASTLRLDAEGRVLDGYYAGTPMQWLLGDLGEIQLRGRVRIRDNRMVFSVDTPRDRRKDLTLQGVLRNVIPTKRHPRPWLNVLADFSLTSIAGPWDAIEVRDETVQRRRERTIGARIRLSGPLAPGTSPEVTIESFGY